MVAEEGLTVRLRRGRKSYQETSRSVPRALGLCHVRRRGEKHHMAFEVIKADIPLVSGDVEIL